MSPFKGKLLRASVGVRRLASRHSPLCKTAKKATDPTKCSFCQASRHTGLNNGSIRTGTVVAALVASDTSVKTRISAESGPMPMVIEVIKLLSGGLPWRVLPDESDEDGGDEEATSPRTLRTGLTRCPQTLPRGTLGVAVAAHPKPWRSAKHSRAGWNGFPSGYGEVAYRRVAVERHGRVHVSLREERSKEAGTRAQMLEKRLRRKLKGVSEKKESRKKEEKKENEL
ncbi:hypothetical protein DFJ73DRAFT_757717 [Zopfochytrium polystomum]|nr:hypothetical protein DFJ73DRAFT_757717 [Zopfochytrium polystomum]